MPVSTFETDNLSSAAEVLPHEQRARELAQWALGASAAHASLGLRAPRGLVLSGPAGCGKRRLARILASECSARYLERGAEEILARFYSQGVAALDAVLDYAVAQAPCLLLIRDVDLLLPAGAVEDGRPESVMIAHLLAYLEALPRESRFLFVGASARPAVVSKELRRRGLLDREIMVPVPNHARRREILAERIGSLPLVGEVDLDLLARMTSGFTGLDLGNVCQQAALLALRRHSERPEVHGEDFIAALRLVEATASDEIFLEIPAARWADIGGLREAKQRLRELVEWPLRHSDLYAQAGLPCGKGVLLCGPPGSGKTLLARAVAKESGVGFLALRGSVFHTQHEHPAESLHEAFRRARQAAPCILFLDDLDLLLGRFLSSHFLAEMNTLAGQRDVVVLAATSRTEKLDPAVMAPGVLEEVIDVPPPSAEDRREILALQVKRRPPLEHVDLAALARATDGFTGADLIGMCDRAARLALHREIESGGHGHPTLLGSDFDAALEEIRHRQRRHFE